jgi:toxin FitB
MRHLLDTNIISNITKPVPSSQLLEWMAEQPDDDLFISSLSLAEIRRGILEKPVGKKRKELEQWFAGPEGPQSLFRGRVLPFDERAALVWARLMSEGTAAGRPRSAFDMVVAAIAEVNDCVVVTDNEKHFPGVELLNPLRLPGRKESSAR